FSFYLQYDLRISRTFTTRRSSDLTFCPRRQWKIPSTLHHALRARRPQIESGYGLRSRRFSWTRRLARNRQSRGHRKIAGNEVHRTEEHTSELQSPDHLVYRLPLEK